MQKLTSDFHVSLGFFSHNPNFPIRCRIFIIFLDFKLSPCLEYSMSSFGWFHGVWFIIADVSEHSIYSVFIGRKFEVNHFEPSAYEDGTDRVFRNVGNYKSDAGESPKRRHTIFTVFTFAPCMLLHSLFLKPTHALFVKYTHIHI
jgi:hypothetical protein